MLTKLKRRNNLRLKFLEICMNSSRSLSHFGWLQAWIRDIVSAIVSVFRAFNFLLESFIFVALTSKCRGCNITFRNSHAGLGSDIKLWKFFFKCKERCKIFVRCSFFIMLSKQPLVIHGRCYHLLGEGKASLQ